MNKFCSTPLRFQIVQNWWILVGTSLPDFLTLVYPFRGTCNVNNGKLIDYYKRVDKSIAFRSDNRYALLSCVQLYKC